MAPRVVKLPDIGEGVAEAEVSAWHVKVGDMVREDQVLADVMTDKATVEIPSPADGKILALGVEAGQMLAVGGELVRIEIDGADDAVRPEPTSALVGAQDAVGEPARGDAGHAAGGPEPVPPVEPFPSGPGDRPGSSGVGKAAEDRPSPGSTVRARPQPGERPLASPAVRRRALENGVDLRRVRGTGPAGRIVHADIDAFVRGEGESPSSPAGRSANSAVEEVKVIGLRRRIAQRMAESKRRAAHFSYVDEVDVTALEELRAALNERRADARPKLTLIPFLVQALVRVLPDFPQMNAHYDDEGEVVRRFGGVHVGIATQTPAGLMVPVVRHAEARSLWEVAAEVRRLADAARAGAAQREELSGSTITVTSLGPLGGIMTTPVLNRPEVAILGVNKQVTRPVWKDAAFVPRLTMNLSASFDHRVVDGYDAALFVQALKAHLETPALLFVDP